MNWSHVDVRAKLTFHSQDMLTMLQTNVAAVMEFTRAFAPPMVQRNRGHIVNISSVAGHEAYSGACRPTSCLAGLRESNVDLSRTHALDTSCHCAV